MNYNLLTGVNQTSLHCFEKEKVTTNETVQTVKVCQTHEVRQLPFCRLISPVHLIVDITQWAMQLASAGTFFNSTHDIKTHDIKTSRKG